MQALLRLVIAHHGELQYGSAKEPLMMEAVALYLIDLTDSRMGAVEDEVAKTERKLDQSDFRLGQSRFMWPEKRQKQRKLKFKGFRRSLLIDIKKRTYQTFRSICPLFYGLLIECRISVQQGLIVLLVGFASEDQFVFRNHLRSD